MFQSEEARNLVSSINKEFPHYRHNPKLTEPIKKLQYSIKVAQKKIENSRKHLDANINMETPKITSKKRKSPQITLPEKNLLLMDHDFNDLKSDPVGTPITTRTLSNTPRKGSGE